MAQILICGAEAQSDRVLRQAQDLLASVTLAKAGDDLQQAVEASHLLLVLIDTDPVQADDLIAAARHAGRRVLPVRVAADGVAPPAALLEHPLIELADASDDDPGWDVLRGALAFSLGDTATAQRLYNAARRGYVGADNRAGEAVAMEGIGGCYARLGDYGQALVYYNQALPLVQAHQPPTGEARLSLTIGHMYASLRQRDDAIECYEQVTPRYEALGDALGAALSLVNIGRLREELQDPKAALAAYRRAAKLLHEINASQIEATVLTNIGAIYARTGKLKRALETYQQSLALLEADGNTQGRAVTLNNIGRVYDQLNQHKRALETYQAALPLYAQMQNISGEAITHYNIGHLYYRQGDLDAAERHIAKSVALEEKLGHPDMDEDRRFLNQIRALQAERDQHATDS